ncbi:mandelate racemase/muconate lactonizing enzyme family protein [Microbacterium sp. SYP-A9085]|uniref:mandelate racemase/muconate lactonizing enzyme family protein n=1 Tax=Microbacterium sp. SYP-A9085 TaxID=2664454 RepID=UPI00129A389D|nr:mandelate racemase/muconate lactonizing enzyme family protein [Microbacterium sp. SYP-A9085]MRH28517.1 mandelate racemase/muconate lactonizing enzyme family protein [Microbacterium sp. SYP-A9085]
MKIAKIAATWYQAPFARPIANSTFTYGASNKVVVRIHTDGGLVGTGWTNGTGLAMAIARDMGQRIVGRDALDRTAALAVLADDKVYGRGGLSAKSRSAIDIALWDLAGQVSGLSIHRMLGAHRDRVPAYVAGGYYAEGKDLSSLAEEALGALSLGARAFKMKIGLADPKRDLERVAAVRSAVGPDVALLVDANGGYDRATARLMADGLREFDVAWFEEPIDSRDVEGQAALRAAAGIPIASGESEHSLHEMGYAIRSRAMDVLNADAQCVDGITGWAVAAQMAAEEGIPVAPHGDQELHVHLAAAVPHGTFVEYYHGVNALREEMFVERLELNDDGTVSPPDRPGLGFVFDEERLARFRRDGLEAGAA